RMVTTRRDPEAARAPDLVRRRWRTPTRPDQWWVADFTYVWTLEGFVYTSFVSDVCSRRILGWRVSSSKATPLVMSALEQALFTRRRADARFTAEGIVFHSDAGSQYTALSFTEALLEAGIAPSVGTVGDALDKEFVSHCTSWGRFDQDSFGEAASHAFDQSGVAGGGRLEEAFVLVVRSVGAEKPGLVPALDRGRMDSELVGDLADGEETA